ncbi:amidohydrolase family protein [Stagonosporopsis vannaccii]|nr:amidohydrolase family protein [Stagonosporopsis vannaccii]
MRMHLPSLLSLALGTSLAEAAATLLAGGTVIAWNSTSSSLQIMRNGSVLVENDTITSIFSGTNPANFTLPGNLTVIDASNDILTPGFIDTHRHSWQTAFKTLGSNTTLLEYLPHFGTPSSAATEFSAEDVYIGQLAGLYEALNAGVTSVVDFAHCAWSDAHVRAALRGMRESGVRGVYAFYFGDAAATKYTVDAQAELFGEMVGEEKGREGGRRVELGISYDGFSGGNASQTQTVVDLASTSNMSLLTTHANGGVYGAPNFPSALPPSLLNTSLPLIFAHASYLSVADAQLLRTHNHYISTTPESEMHYGHLHPHSHVVLDQVSLGVDTHFTFSTDILTQARLWLQGVRKVLFEEVVERRRAPANNPMSVVQAFLLATRAGGLAMRRQDLGVLAVGAKADVVVWEGRSPGMLGWRDPVAAVMLHASVGDVKHVLVGGEVVKRDGRLTAPGYEGVQERFLASAERIQDVWAGMERPVLEGEADSGVVYERTLEADVQRGEGTGYGELYLERT